MIPSGHLTKVRRVLRRLVGRLRFREGRFPGSETYWEQRYAHGGMSGAGSVGSLAAFKAEFLNAFVAKHQIQAVMEFGCGDGQQLELARYPRYVGYDISPTALHRCAEKFARDPTKRFALVANYAGENAELVISLDVVYHLVENHVFESYMRLFSASQRFVIIYSSNTDRNDSDVPPHVRHRHFSEWIEVHLPDWRLVVVVPNRFPYRDHTGEGSFADFYVFERARANVNG